MIILIQNIVYFFIQKFPVRSGEKFVVATTDRTALDSEKFGE